MRYRNLEPQYEPHSLATVLKWMSRRRRPAPKRAEVPVQVPDFGLIARAASLTWIGHATWLVRLCGRSIVTDPVWSETLGPGITRNVRPPMSIDQASPDVVLVSHNHRDHLDAPTIGRIGPEATYLVPMGLGSFFTKRKCRRVVEMEWWQSEAVGDLRVTFVPSQHWSQRGPFDRNDTLWGGYVIEGEGKKVYFAGDTAYFDGFAEIGRRHPGIDAALLPIGAYDPEWFMRSQHMNPEDAVNAFVALRAELLCAMHWGTFKLTDEPLDEPPRLLEEHRARAGIPPERVWVAAIGETRAL